MVKLQKHFAYKYKDKEHYKFVVTIPSVTVEQLKWKPQTELDLTVSPDKSIVLKPSLLRAAVDSNPQSARRKYAAPNRRGIIRNG